MASCAKCGADLIGSKKFCAACGAPAVDPKTIGAPANVPPPANPYASTALADKLQKMQAEYGPPPAPSTPNVGVPPSAPSAPALPIPPPHPSSRPTLDANANVDPPANARTGTVAMPSIPLPSQGGLVTPSAAPLSPLASSNIVAPIRRGTPPMGIPAQNVSASQLAATAPQLGPHPAPPQIAPSPAPPQIAPSPAPATIAMSAIPTPQQIPIQRPPTPAAFTPPQAQPQHQLQPQLQPPNMFGSQVQRGPSSAYAPPPTTQQPPLSPAPLPPQPPPGAMGSGGYPAQQQMPAAMGSQPQVPYGPPPAFGAGALVYVQWADGNRYPATVQQVSGTQYLVLFNDGRQQWVEARFISLGM